MGNNNRWLKARKRHRILIAKIQRIAGGSLIAALIVGPLIYFSVIAMPLEMKDGNRFAANLRDNAATPEIDIAATQELRISTTPIPLPKEDSKLAKILLKSEKKDLKLEIDKSKFEATPEAKLESIAGDLPEAEEQKLESFFDGKDVKIKKIESQKQTSLSETDHPSKNKILVIDDLTLDNGPAKIAKKDDAKKTADKALQKYLRSELKSTDFRIFGDTSILDKNKKPYQLVLSNIKHNNGKWYVTYQQYSNALPVFDGNIKLIFTNEKKLIAISDNIKRDLPDESEFKIGKALAKEKTKEVFEWDDSIDEIDFINKGYYENKPVYKVDSNAHDPLGEWEVFVDGVEGDVTTLSTNIRLQDIPPTPQPDLSGTPDSGLETLDNLFSRILGTVYPKTPNDELTTEPLAHSYAYTEILQHETDEDGYFENPSMQWYSTFLDGPYVTVHDDDATSNMEIVNETPETPFVWDENSASLAAINAFYHTNKMHDYFSNTIGYEIGKNIPLTVNSELVDAYINGCGAWFNNSEKTIEIGRGGTPSCPTELNYALGSDFMYHEYTHFIVEDITHLPNIAGSESAAMGEAFADYFAATVNDDPIWGDIIAPTRTRNLVNTLNYDDDMIGESHHDGMILSGALWDLRTEIGQEATDKLVFNTLFQDRYHFETFMYGMIIEDDDNDDFSDGTPHLAEIITAFDNHGIGPGIEDFNGLPLSPEAWEELLNETPPEGEEDPLEGAYSGTGCSVSGSNLTVTGGSCYITGSQSFNYVYVQNGGTLRIGQNGYNAATTLTINGNMAVYSGGNVYVGDHNYNSRIYFSASTGTKNLSIYGTVQTVGLDTATNYIDGNPYTYVYDGGILNIFDGSSSYRTDLGSLTVYDTGTVNVGGTGFCWPQPCTPPLYKGQLDVNGTARFRRGATLNVKNTLSYFFADGFVVSDSSYSASDINNDGLIYVYGDISVGNSSTIDNSYRFYQSASHSAIIGGGSTITNTSTDGLMNMEFNSPVTLQDTSTQINNSGGILEFNNSLSIYNTASVDNSGGGTTTVLNNVILDNSGYIINRASSSFTVGNAATERITMRGSSQINNYGSFTVYDDIIMGNEVSGGMAKIYNQNGATLTLTSSSDNTLTIRQECFVRNYSGGQIQLSTGASSDSDGVIQVFDGANDTIGLINYGNIQSTAIQVGDGSSYGGTFQNASGATTDLKAGGTALEIYRGEVDNQSGATQFSLSGGGVIKIYGASGDNGIFKDDANSSGRLLLDSYSEMTLTATHTGYTCDILEADDGTDSILTIGTSSVNPAGTLNCTTTNIGTTLYDPGKIIVYGEITGTTLNIFEDSGSPGSDPDDDYELEVKTTGFVHPSTINLGDNSGHYGGEIFNRAGDGIKQGSDSTDEGIVANTYIYNKGNIYNGGDRNGGLLNSSAEYNYENSPSKGIGLFFNTEVEVENHGYIGGSSVQTDTAGSQYSKLFINYDSGHVTSNTIILYHAGRFYNGIGQLRYDSQTANFTVGRTVTGGTSGATAMIIDDKDRGNNGTLLLSAISGTFQDNETITDNNATPGSATVNGTLTTNSNASVNSSTMYIYGSQTKAAYHNYGDTTINQLYIGHPSYLGGELDLEDGGDFSVTSTGTDAVNIYYQGVINAKSGHNTFNVAGRVNVASTTGNSTINVNQGTGRPFFGALNIGGRGIVNANMSVQIDDSGGNTGDLNISGTDDSNIGKLIIGNVIPLPIFEVDGETVVENYGTLENNSRVGGGPYTGFYAHDLVSVETKGTIISDSDSDFRFLNGITSRGIVEIDDDLYVANNGTSGYAIEVTGGAFTTGTASNTGYTAGGNVMITAGTFTTYSDSSFLNFDVTGSSTTANFENSTSPALCNTDIHGYFDITSGATATINCEPSPAVKVHSGSPGGNTQVEGTLIINTNMETETMVVGDGASSSGTVTHELADDTWDAAKTFILTVTDTLTINSNGSLDVSEKSSINPTSHQCSGSTCTIQGFGGAYGGKGQYNETAHGNEYGYIKAHKLYYDSQTADFTEGDILTGSTSDATAKIIYDHDDGTSGYLLIDMDYGSFEDNETITDEHTGSASANGIPSRADFGQYGIGDDYTTIKTGSGSYNIYEGGYGGGTMTINVGEDTDSDGIMNLGTIDIKSGGKISSNGMDYNDGAGSGGSIDIYTYTLTGAGNIEANGGDSTSSSGDKTAGGGGRIRVEYVDKSSYTGTISAVGGTNTDGKQAGTGTILYKWEDKWQNQNDGTVIIDGFTSSDIIDVDLDGNTVSTDSDDSTEPQQAENLDVESIQFDRYGSMLFIHAGATLTTQQCIEANNGILYLSGTYISVNRDHGGTNTTSCLQSPDPPKTLYANNSSTGAQSGLAATDFTLDYDNQTANFHIGATVTGATSGATGDIVIDTDNGTTGTLRLVNISGTFQDNETVTDNQTTPGSATVNGSLAAPVVNDNTPAFSSIYTDAELNRDPTVEDTDGAGLYQIQISPVMKYLWDDKSSNYVCDLDLQTVPSAPLADDARIADIVTNSTTCSLNPNTTYFWRMRYQDDDSTTKTWGLWSPTGQFDVGDYMEITNECSGSLSITDANSGGLNGVGNPMQNHNADRYGTGTCKVHITSSKAGWQLLYGMASGETGLTTAGTYTMDSIDNAGGDCSIDTSGNTEEEEYGFLVEIVSSNLNGKVQQDTNCNNDYYNTTADTFNVESNGSENTIFKDLAANITDGIFNLIMRANIDRFTYKGAYTLDTTLTLTTTP